MAAASLPISVCGRTTPIFMAASLAPRHGAGRERLDVGADVAWAREPDAIAMREDVLQRAAQPADAVGAAEDERVQRDRAHERLARRLREHLVELVHDHGGELFRRV